jgi:hypothetical protein
MTRSITSSPVLGRSVQLEQGRGVGRGDVDPIPIGVARSRECRATIPPRPVERPCDVRFAFGSVKLEVYVTHP